MHPQIFYDKITFRFHPAERTRAMILACNNVNKSFGTEQILKNVSFHINEREKAAIVGINGAGKSTLLKIIMGEMSADQGDIVFSKGSTVGYLPQHQELSTNKTIYEELLEVKQDILDLDRQIRGLEQDMKHTSGEELEQMLALYTRLNHEFEMKNGYAYQSEITGVLKGLGFLEEDFSKTTNTLSGGQKTRVALGKLLLSSPDIILLDEPTNHLDLDSIAWLENYLSNYKGAVVIVAHDRYFLDRVVTKIIEIDQSKASMFLGNYTTYAKKKAQIREAELKQYLNQQREIKHQEEVIAKLRSFNREKSVKRAESREKLLSKIEVLDRPTTDNQTMNLKLEPSITSGNDVLTVSHLKKAFGPLTLFEDISFTIKREEKVAIIGKNGTGKTTILKIINEILPPDGGEIKLGSKVKIGYYDQEHNVLDPEKTLMEEISDAYPNLTHTKIRNVLAAFLFTNDDVFKRIKDLSGGERGRVSLAKLMLSEANLLILDEPTNHLDITSKEILENAIANYTGTVLYVSHDRYFINKTATRILDLTNKQVLNYIGNYNYYLEKKDELEQNLLTEEGATSQTSQTDCASNGLLDWKQQKEEQAKLRKKQNDLKKIEDQITTLETENEEIDTLLTKEEIYTNVEELVKLNARHKEIEEQLELLLEQWSELADE